MWSLAQRALGSTAQRTLGSTADDVEQAVADGRILRTHILRPTWHFVHRDDLGWLMGLSAERLHQGNKGMYRQTGVDEHAAARSGHILAEAVAGGAHKTREELAGVLEQAGFLAKALLRLPPHARGDQQNLVSGAPVRSAGGALKQTYALFDERVPDNGSASLTGDDREWALGQLALRYFTSRGPATIKDCAAWSGLTMKDVRLGLQIAEESMPGALATVAIDGTEFCLPAEDVEALAVTPRQLMMGRSSPCRSHPVLRRVRDGLFPIEALPRWKGALFPGGRCSHSRGVAGWQVGRMVAPRLLRRDLRTRHQDEQAGHNSRTTSHGCRSGTLREVPRAWRQSGCETAGLSWVKT